MSSIVNGFYAESHGYVKGETLINITEIPIDYTTVVFSKKDFLGYSVYREADGGNIADSRLQKNITPDFEISLLSPSFNKKEFKYLALQDG